MQARLHYRQYWSFISMRLLSRISLISKCLKEPSRTARELSSIPTLNKVNSAVQGSMSMIYFNLNLIIQTQWEFEMTKNSVIQISQKMKAEQ